MSKEQILNNLSKPTWVVPKTPMGVSQWRNYGKQWGYWAYFKDEVKTEFLKVVEDGLDALMANPGEEDDIAIKALTDVYKKLEKL